MVLKNIKNVFFDNGGTLNAVPPHADKGISQVKQIIDILNLEDSPEDLQKKLYDNDKKYKKWSLDNWVELSEEEIFTKWLLPDYKNKELIEKNASELMFLLMASRGKRTVLPEVKALFEGLAEKGYNIGIISNTTSRTVVPDKYKEENLYHYLKTVTLSSITGIRKPDPAIFNLACEEIGAKPEESIYVGDQPSRDMEGPKRANFAYSILIQNPEKPLENIEELPEMFRPDVCINSLLELLEILPDLN